MNPLRYLRGASAQRLLARAGKASGTPVALHYVGHGEEGPRIAGSGACGMCRHVASLPGGRAACRESRSTVAARALQQGRPVSFLCHMGFACVTVPALPGESFLVTFGPYCPAEAARSLPEDARRGLSALVGVEVLDLPVPLDDVHRVPAEAIPEMAAWLQEMLAEGWAENRDTSPPETEKELSGIPPTGGSSRRVSAMRARQGRGNEGVLAFAAADFTRVGAWLDAFVDESEGQVSHLPAVKRARLVSAVSQLLEGAAGAGLSTENAWAAFPEFAAMQAKQEVMVMRRAALRLLREQAAAWRKERAPALRYTMLNNLLRDCLDKRITLEEVAGRLGESPSAVSHRLRRKFGMSFSEYVGRMRTAKARALLRRTKLSTAAIGKRVGVSDVSNFRALFRKYEGMTPAAYREQFGKKR